MTDDRIIIKAVDEDAHFREMDRKMLEKLRADAQKDQQAAYTEAHRNHCFRCGTKSLVEMEYKNLRVDICVNDGCGAVHLDPGEPEKLLAGERGVFGKIKTSLFSSFK